MRQSRIEHQIERVKYAEETLLKTREKLSHLKLATGDYDAADIVHVVENAGFALTMTTQGQRYVCWKYLEPDNKNRYVLEQNLLLGFIKDEGKYITEVQELIAILVSKGLDR